MSGVLNALSGLSAAGQRFEAASERVVKAGAAASNAFTDRVRAGEQGEKLTLAPVSPSLLSDDLGGALIDMMEAEQSFKANARVAGRLSDMHKAYLELMDK